jgi:hypothetical protein
VRRLKVDDCGSLVDLLEVKRCSYGDCCLVEVVSALLSVLALSSDLHSGWLAHRTVSSFSSSPSFLALPTKRCRSFVLQPSRFMNWSNSSTLLLQQL